MEPIDILAAAFAIGALLMTIYLRKDLEAHGLHLWVYLGVPLLTVSGLGHTFSDSFSADIEMVVVYWSAVLAMAVMLVGAVLALLRRD